jgi:NAD(P)-dependent dehydrogenase (short-subunit alcohol dehydrogenase family)
VAQHQPLAAGRRPSVLAGDDLAVGPAHAEGDAVDQEVARTGLGLVDVDDRGRPRLQRHHRERAHGHRAAYANHRPYSRPMDIDLSGRTAFISGSTQGIGRAIAARLAGSGAHTVVNGRDAGRVEHAVGELRREQPGARIDAVSADVATAAGAEEVFSAFPAVDILVNNLGIFAPTPVLEVDDATWQRYWEVNVLSGVRLARHYLPGMRDRGWGRVQFMASESAVLIPLEMVHYGVTKTALLGLARGLAKAMAGTGVTVNTVIAGPTHTEGVEEFVRSVVGAELAWDDAQTTFMREHRPGSLIQRLIEPEEIANLVAYLSSDLASATTGGAVRVDGGLVDHILP